MALARTSGPTQDAPIASPETGPDSFSGFGNGLTLGYLMYRSGLVPPRMAILGLVGGPMLIISFVLVLFGAESDRRAQGGDGIAQPPERIGSFTSDR